MENKNQLTKPVIKKLENAYAIWFNQSGSFILLEEPAYSVFAMLSDGKSQNEIVGFCKNKYGHLEENIEQFVGEITDYINLCRTPKTDKEVSFKSGSVQTSQAEVFQHRVMYKAGNKYITVYYKNGFLKDAVHPVLKHLEVSSSLPDENVIQLVEHKRKFFFNYNGKSSVLYDEENMEYFTGSVKQQLYSILYNCEFNDWMMTLHASGVLKKGQTVLFSAAGGSGKSSVSVLLKAHGYGYISDDFIAADCLGKVYPFPAAISVKEGAIKTLSKFYPELNKKDAELAFNGKNVRYLPVYNQEEITYAPYPVKALVFVRFNKSESFVFEEVNKKEALQLLLKETWVNPQPEKVNTFFNWIENTSFYRLQYAQTHHALEAVDKLFGNSVQDR